MDPSSDAPLVTATGLHRRFGKRSVLEDIDISVLPGEVLGLVGPNGGGKSTLLLLLAGLLRPTRGTVFVGSVPAHKVAVRQTGTIGLITCDPGLYPLLTGRENLRYFGALYGLSRWESDARVEPLLADLDFGDALDRRVAEYSSGMAQKVSLARALLMQPRLLLLDEPTSNLDPVSAHTIHDALRRLADEGLGTVLATHDLASAEMICDRVAVLNRRIHHVETFDGPRRAPEPGRLLSAWQAAMEAP